MEQKTLKKMADVEARLKNLHNMYDGTDAPEARLLTEFDSLPQLIKRYVAQKRLRDQQLKMIKANDMILIQARKDILSQIDRFMQIPS